MTEQRQEYQIRATHETIVSLLASNYPEVYARCLAEAAALEGQVREAALQAELDELKAAQAVEEPDTPM